MLHGGKQEGVDVISLDNGQMTVVIVPTRGMSILGATMGKVRLGWDSPIREVVHPSMINLHDRDGFFAQQDGAPVQIGGSHIPKVAIEYVESVILR